MSWAERNSTESAAQGYVIRDGGGVLYVILCIHPIWSFILETDALLIKRAHSSQGLAYVWQLFWVFFSFLLVQNVYRVVHDGLPTHLGYECVKGSEFSLCSLAEYISVTVPDDLSAHTQWSISESWAVPVAALTMTNSASRSFVFFFFQATSKRSRRIANVASSALFTCRYILTIVFRSRTLWRFVCLLGQCHLSFLTHG